MYIVHINSEKNIHGKYPHQNKRTSKTVHEWQSKMKLTQNAQLLPERSEFWVSGRAQESHPLYQKQRQNPKQKRKEALVMWQSEPTNSADIQDQHLLSTAYELPDDYLQTCLSPVTVTKLAHLASLVHLHMYIFFCCFSLTMDIELQNQSKSPRQYGDMLL